MGFVNHQTPDVIQYIFKFQINYQSAWRIWLDRFIQGYYTVILVPMMFPEMTPQWTWKHQGRSVNANWYLSRNGRSPVSSHGIWRQPVVSPGEWCWRRNWGGTGRGGQFGTVRACKSHSILIYTAWFVSSFVPYHTRSSPIIVIYPLVI